MGTSCCLNQSSVQLLKMRNRYWRWQLMTFILKIWLAIFALSYFYLVSPSLYHYESVEDIIRLQEYFACSQVQQEFGSFNNYCWGFVNQKPIKNCYRYARHVPAKTPKAEVISKDLMRKGFRCVGPTVVYSFMQAAGLVNDHLVTCFRYQECNSNVTRNTECKVQEAELAEAMEKTCLVPM